jgi:NAD-dependent dihydropyrimidine dehydrogenase PreA subunit
MRGTTYLKNVTTLNLDTDKCVGCAVCVEVCPHNVLAMVDKRATIVDKDLCMECGACQKNCAYEAITVANGVGCAAAIIIGAVKGTEPTCGCSGSSCCG